MNGRLVRNLGSLFLLVGGLWGCQGPGAPASEVEESHAALSAAPWADKDIGTTGATGSASFTAPDTFDVNGSGSDIYGTSDSFHFVYQAITGDATLIAQVTSVPTTNAWAKAGVMIRESLNANAKEMLAAVTPNNGVTSQKRTTTGGSTSFMTAGGLTAPYYVKIQRSGSTFTTSRSADGKTWTTLETATISMTSSAYIGLAVTAHNAGATCNAQFKAVSLSLSNGGPVITTQPQDVSVLEGTTAVFSVAATGSGTLTYQWYQVTSTGTYALAAGNSLTIFTNPGPGAPTPPFTNKYYCVVKDSSGRTVQSRTVSLNVLAKTFVVKGRLAIPDAYDCTGGTTSLAMTWADCHKFKQHFDPATGAAITSNSYVSGALRPLAAAFWINYQSWPDGAVCDGGWVQTDANGYFSTTFNRCTPASQGAFGFTVQLKYDVTAADAPGTTLGNIRALWAREKIPQAYWARDVDVLYTATDINGVTSNYVIPTVVSNQILAVPNTNQMDIGTLVLNGNDYPIEYQHYVQAAQAAWQNMVALHGVARTGLRDSRSATPNAEYAKLFTTAAYMTCTQCYTLFFDLTGGFGGGAGGLAVMTTAAPAPNITDQQQAALSSAGLIAHEFGHGIHESLAQNSFQADGFFSGAARNPDGSEYGISHMTFGPATASVYQLQEAGLALIEGFAEAMARFLLLDGCNGYNATFEAPGNEDMLANMWNPSHYTDCDSMAGSGCPFHNFRRQMHARGIAEGSAEWNRRLNALSTLASNAATGGMKRVLSNNEGKAATFLCKLLAQDPDYSSMASTVNGTKYIDDYLYDVSEILDGRTPTPTWRSYSQGLTSERAHVSLLGLLRSMNQLCPNCVANPSLIPSPLWQFPSLTDGGNALYDSKRLSIYGMLSPQQLSQILINQGLASKSAMNNLLRASFMEELP